MTLEYIELAIYSLKSNKMRSLLTMLGIIIGIMSVIAIVTIGNAIYASISTELQSMGTSNIMINVANRSDSGSGAAATDFDLITASQINEFYEQFSDKIKEVSYSSGIGAATARDGRLYANISLVGASPGYPTVNNIKMSDGRFINDKDIQAYRNSIVVSDKLVEKMFGSRADPIGRELKIYNADGVVVYTIIGVYKYETVSLLGGSTSPESDEELRTSSYIPITTAKQNSNYKNHTSFTAMLAANMDAKTTTTEIQEYFDKIYANNTRYEISVISLEGQIESITSVLSLVQLAVGVIASISLLVGGIGVMNIMLVSVTERTREVGTRKALGAKNFHIQFQFIVEAVIISTVGGIIGIVLGLLSGLAITKFMNTTASVSPSVVLLSVGFSMVIGVFFGYYPANKAAKLDPIEALRYE